MIAADGQAVAVAGGQPDLQVGPRDLDTAGQRRSAAVDAVKTISVHVVREAAGAADARYKHELLPRDAQVWQHLADLGQDGIVAATRAPAHFLVALEIVGLENLQTRRSWHGS